MGVLEVVSALTFISLGLTAASLVGILIRFHRQWLDSLKQVALTFIVLSLIMAASAMSGAAVNGFPLLHSIGTGSSNSVASQIVSSGMFLLLLAGFAWWRVRPDWWRTRREIVDLPS